MGKQPEAGLSTRIMKAWRKRGAWCYKVWGNEFQMSGVPDISGTFMGWSVWCESKMPGNKPSPIQAKRMNDIRDAGGLCVVAYNVSEALQMLEHIESGDHSRLQCNCLYTQKFDLTEYV